MIPLNHLRIFRSITSCEGHIAEIGVLFLATDRACRARMKQYGIGM